MDSDSDSFSIGDEDSVIESPIKPRTPKPRRRAAKVNYAKFADSESEVDDEEGDEWGGDGGESDFSDY